MRGGERRGGGFGFCLRMIPGMKDFFCFQLFFVRLLLSVALWGWMGEGGDGGRL